MSPGTKTALIVAACLGLVGALVAGAGWYVYSKKDQWLAEGQAIHEEGLRAGASVAESECVRDSMARYRKDPSVLGAIASRVWLAGCLETSRPESDFCTGVPNEDAILDSATWRVGICSRYGIEGDSTCPNVPAEVQGYCHGAARAQKRSAT